MWFKEFIGGLDTRRLPEAASGGVLIKANNGHITRGGEFEQRAAFVPEFALPEGTIGLSHTTAGIFVFGHQAEPSGMPGGVSYQRLQHPDGTTALVRVLSTDLYAGKLYAVSEFADGGVYHFYDGTRVTDWYDGRARATFSVVGGSAATAAVAATGAFTITAGTSGAGNKLTSVTVDGIEILGAPVAHTGNNATTAAAVAAQITAFSSTPEYTATAIGAAVTITSSATGTAPNGRVVAPVVGGDVTVGGVTNMSGGADSSTPRLVSISVGGIAIISAPVNWVTSNEATATAIAAAVNGFSSSPDYTASAVGANVSIAASLAGASANGRVVSFSIADGMAISPASTTMANGADSSSTHQPGGFVKTVGQKVYSVSGSNLHFSGVQAPTKWTTDSVGAGFIDMSSESSGSEELIAIARYQTFLAVFAERIIQIWYLDPDPELLRQTQVLSNTGTASAHSVTAFGDADLFYLDESGLRSLRARDSSNSAATADIGVPVDEAIVAKLATLDENERKQITGLIEPSDGRFWLIMKDQIFAFSFFAGAKVSAWSTYDTTYQNEDDAAVTFNVEYADVYRRRVYLRAGNTIYVYGGLGGSAYDASVAEAWLPYMDADDPTRYKEFTGIDVVLRGLWETSAAMDPTDETAEDKIAILDSTTFSLNRIPFAHHATHASLRFRSQGTGPHRLGACVIHFRGSAGED